MVEFEDLNIWDLKKITLEEAETLVDDKSLNLNKPLENDKFVKAQYKDFFEKREILREKKPLTKHWDRLAYSMSLEELTCYLMGFDPTRVLTRNDFADALLATEGEYIDLDFWSENYLCVAKIFGQIRNFLKTDIEKGELESHEERGKIRSGMNITHFIMPGRVIYLSEVKNWVKNENLKDPDFPLVLMDRERYMASYSPLGLPNESNDEHSEKKSFKGYALLLEKVTGERVESINRWIAHEVLARICGIRTTKSNKDAGCAVHNEGSEVESKAYCVIEVELKKCGFKSKPGRLVESDKDKLKKQVSEIVQKIFQESDNSDMEVIKSLKGYLCGAL